MNTKPFKFWWEWRYFLCNRSNVDIFTCKNNMLFSRVKISCFRAKAHLVFHCCLYNKCSFVALQKQFQSTTRILRRRLHGLPSQRHRHLKSAIRKKMAPRIAYWVDRHIGLKFEWIWWQITFFSNEFWTIYEQQSKDTRHKSVFTKSEECSCARKPLVAFLTFRTFPCKLSGKKKN